MDCNITVIEYLNMKIALIGMPTSGKSTISKLLVDALSFSFIDLDALLEKKFQMPLQHFINLEGEDEFISQENSLMLEIKYPPKTIISTGGSVVYATEAMNKLKDAGVHFVYLQTPIDVLEARLETQRDVRGIVMNGSKNWSELLHSRDQLYRKYADTVINTENKSANDISFEIINTVVK